MGADAVTIVDGPTKRAPRRSEGRGDWSTWPQYESSSLGLPGRYWYPVLWSSQLRSKPLARKLLGQDVMFVRENGRPYALRDRCPHRGVPLSYGDQQFPGTISCPYHGWTFDLESGVMCAAITDGPDSPLCNKVGVDTFPVAEQLGLVWIFIGPPGTLDDGEVPPIETAIPDELLRHDSALGGNIEVRTGGWRFAAENGYDEGHAKYLHRNSLWRRFRLMPAWTKTRVVESDGDWITRVNTEVHWEADFPGLGIWSAKRWWKVGSGSKVLGLKPSEAANVDPIIASLDLPGQQSIRLPGLLRIVHRKFIHYEWYVPMDDDQYRYVQMMVQFKRGFAAFLFKLRYAFFIRWVFHGQFSGEDKLMVDVMDAPPERLYRPDVSITSWRRICEQAPRHGQAVVANGARPEGAADASSPEPG